MTATSVVGSRPIDLRVLEDALVEQRDRHLVGVGDDVIVREDVAVVRDDEARAARLFRLIVRADPVELPEEVFDARRQLLPPPPPPTLRRLRRWRRLGEALRLDRDDGRARVIGDGLERRLRLGGRGDLRRRGLGRRRTRDCAQLKSRQIEARTRRRVRRETRPRSPHQSVHGNTYWT